MGIISFHPSSLVLAQLCTRCMDDTLQANTGAGERGGSGRRALPALEAGDNDPVKDEGSQLVPRPAGGCRTTPLAALRSGWWPSGEAV